MKKYYMELILALVLITGGGVLLVRAQAPQGNDAGPGVGVGKGMGHGGWMGGGHGMFLQHLARYLNLSDAQKAQIKSLVQAQRPVMQPVIQQLAAARKDMLTATASGAFDQAKVSAIASREAQFQAQLEVVQQELQAKIYNTVLTSDQKTKVDQMRQKQLDRINQRLQNSTTTPQE